MLINDTAAFAASTLMDEAAELMTTDHLAAQPPPPAADEVSTATAQNLAAHASAVAANATQSASAMRSAAQALRSTFAGYRSTEQQNASAFGGARAAGETASGPSPGDAPTLPSPTVASTSPIPSISGRPARDNTALLESGPGSTPLLAHALALPGTAAQHARAAQLLAEAGRTIATGTDAAFTPGAAANAGHLATAALKSAADTSTLAAQYGALAGGYERARATAPSSAEIEATQQQLNEAIEQNAASGGALQPYVDSLWQKLQNLQAQTDGAVDGYQADGEQASDPTATQQKALDPSMLLGIVSALPQLAQQLSQLHLPQVNPSQALAPLMSIAQMAGSLLSQHPGQHAPFRPAAALTPSGQHLSPSHSGKGTGGSLHPAGLSGKSTMSQPVLAASPTGTANPAAGPSSGSPSASPSPGGGGMMPLGAGAMARSGENTARTSKYDRKTPAAPEQTGRAAVDRATAPRPIAVPENVKEKIQRRTQVRAQSRQTHNKENT